MNSKEARACLEVPEIATFEEIRRAYLKKVKQHNPEVDPEGFAQVRGAFEQLKLARDLEERFEGGDLLDVAPPPAPPDERPAIEATEARKADDVARSEFEALVQAYEAIDFFDHEARGVLLLKAWDKPSRALLDFTLEKLIGVASARETLLQCLRKAVDAKIPTALYTLGQLAPGRVREGELASLLNADDARDRLFGAHILVARGEAAGVMDVVLEILQGPPEFPVGPILDLGLYALQCQQSSLASDLRDGLTGRFQTYQDEAKVLGQAEAVGWAAWQELLRLAVWVPPGIVSELAAMFRGEPVSPRPILANKLVACGGFSNLAETRRRAEDDAPLICKVLNLAIPVSQVDPQKSGFPLPRLSWGTWGILIYFFVKVASCAMETDHANTPNPELVRESLAQLRRNTETSLATRPPPGRGDSWRQIMVAIQDRTCAGPGVASGNPGLGWEESEAARKLACQRMRALIGDWDNFGCEGAAPPWEDRPGDIPAMVEFLKSGRWLRTYFCDSTKTRR